MRKLIWFEKSVTKVEPGQKAQRLFRWKLCFKGGWKLAIHMLDMRASDGHWHSHQWASITLCLWGFVLERTDKGKVIVFPGRIRARPAGFRHQVLGNIAITLILTSPRRCSSYVWYDGLESDPTVYIEHPS